MPNTNNILNLEGLQVEHIEGGTPFYVFAKAKNRPNCPECNSSNLHLKSHNRVKLHHTHISYSKLYIMFKKRQFRCRECNRYFYEQIHGIEKWKRATNSFRFLVYDLHTNGLSQSFLSEFIKVSCSTMERWYHQILKHKELYHVVQNFPEYLGMDEHFFSKKKGFSTTLCDLKNKRIYDIILGKSEQAISSQLCAYSGREKVKMVCMDLCDSYRNIAKKYFPKAKIVADRFHVIRLVNHHFLKTWHILDPSAKHSRGLLCLMRRHFWSLSREQKLKLSRYIKQVPGLRQIYLFKQRLNKLLLFRTENRIKTTQQVRTFLDMINQLKASHFSSLVTLGKTLESWQTEIVTMWNYKLTNSITEGFHRKMKLIQRRAYGFKNFQNYRLRVRALCV